MSVAGAGRSYRRSGASAALRALTLLALLLLSACRSVVGEREATVTAPSLDIVTLNLWHDKGDWPRRQALIVAELRRLQPDVIVLQEVLQDTGLPNQAGELARQLGYHRHFVSVDPPERVRRYGNAILTRKAPLLRGERPLRPADDYRIAGWVRTEVGGRAVNVYVAHLNFTDASGTTRAQQIADLLAFVASTRGDAPMVIAGDFNAPATRPEFAPLHERSIDAYGAMHPGADEDAAAHTTLNPHAGHAPVRIDHVFAQRDAFRVVAADIILDRADAAGVWPSDHYGVRAVLAPAVP